MIADSIALLPRAGQAAGLRRRALLRRLPRRRRLRARVRPRRGRGRGRERHPLRHQRRQPAGVRRRGDRGGGRALGDGVEIGIHTHDDAGCAVANSLAAVSRGAAGTGHRQRLRRALRQRQPGLDPAGAAAEDGLRGVSPEQLASLTQTSPLPRRNLQPHLRPRRPYVGRNAFAHKAGMHAAGVAADARTFEHLDPALVGNARDHPSPPSSPAGRRSAAAPSGPGSSWTTPPPRARSSS